MWRRTRRRCDGELWSVVFQFEVWRVSDLPPFEGHEAARSENADFYRSFKWKRDPNWLRVAQVSVECVRRSSAWSHGDWLRVGDRAFPEPPDRYAFGSLFGGVSVSASTWYDGRHRALAQIDAGALEIVARCD